MWKTLTEGQVKFCRHNSGAGEGGEPVSIHSASVALPMALYKYVYDYDYDKPPSS